MIQSLRAAIRTGVLERGAKLPPVRELAWDLGITPGTVARAYKMAAEEGLVETGVGRGTFVAGGLVSPAADIPLMNLPQPGHLDLRAVRVPDVGQEAQIRQILQELARTNVHGYVDYPNIETDHGARVAVAHWIGPDRAGRIAAEDVVLGLGAQNSVMMALQTVLHGTTPVILTESLAYPGVRHAARLLRAQLIGVDMDAHGVRPDRLEEVLRRHGGQVFLTSPELHSPTTLHTPAARKAEVAAVARQFELQIIEDDCHCLTRPETPAYRALCPERAWFISSLSKTVSAALRFGYAVAPKGQGAQARQVAQSSFYGMPQPIVDLVTSLLRSGAAEETRAKVETEMARKVRMAVNALGGWDVQWREDAPFLWLKMPQGWRGSTFARACESKGIRIKPADEFALPDGQAPNAVRVSLNPYIPEPELEAALSTMSALLAVPPLAVDI
ncbi:PLP-dependent aminotransferase family protein [Roseovarius aestuariivivens]|uniref:aminotransferase-like domain-containing protein n=1 Tax=Roseovarius aestuariivivens TaxID=1888910 RepID=UPI001FD9607D|nr:PLP-dependent aminotransferase family protein [Roseovarius aestuariivivens]